MPSPISVVLITHNEEVHIGRALETVRWSDNVVVVDSHSRDGTAEICRRFPNVTFVQRDFVNFADQRQYAMDAGLVRHPWVLGIDADETVPQDLAAELAGIASTAHRDGNPAAYETAMRFIMWGKWLKRSSGYPVYFRRFFMPRFCRYVQRGHADTLDVQGNVGRTKRDLVHENLKGLQDWMDKHNRYSTQEAEYALGELAEAPLSDLWARDTSRRRRALKKVYRRLPCQGTLRFLQLYMLQGGFLDGRAGLDFCLLKGFHNWVVNLKMRELRAQRRDSCRISRGCEGPQPSTK